MVPETPLAKADPGSHAGGASGKIYLRTRAPHRLRRREQKVRETALWSGSKEGRRLLQEVAPGIGAGIPHGEPANDAFAPEILHLVGRRSTGPG